jgi:uncharacterized protein YdhG (YjbR/CyaY superfamily)
MDEYIANSPEEVGQILEKIRSVVKKAAPKAEETIRYQMPTFTFNGTYLVYFAAFKKHIGFYPAPNDIPEFKEALAKYGAGRGTLKFPLDEPIPYSLIRRIVKYRIKENMRRVTSKGKKK